MQTVVRHTSRCHMSQQQAMGRAGSHLDPDVARGGALTEQHLRQRVIEAAPVLLTQQAASQDSREKSGTSGRE